MSTPSAATTVQFTVPLQITLTLGAGDDTAAAPTVASAAVRPLVGAETLTAAGEVDQGVLDEGLAILAANRNRTYYDATADGEAAAYYRGIDENSSGTALLTELHTLLKGTHTPRPRYPARTVYPWVDLHPDRKLRSVCSGKTFDPEDIIRDDARIEAVRTRRLQEVVARGAALGPDTLAEELARLDAQLPYNCEHVVPQSSFREAEPMRGDLHHLFACEKRCNSFRGNTPYFDFQDARAVMVDCGRSEPGRFEPITGKGAVARATLYFLLRYPAVVGDAARELQADRLPILLAWHEAEPAGEWERHRNAAIAELQGNRNPLIDRPEWPAASRSRPRSGLPAGETPSLPTRIEVAMTYTDPIEIKVNIGGNVERALTALGLGEGRARKVWFLDDLTEGLEKPLPLLTEDIILRLRRRDNGKEDSTIKLRPCRRSQLAGKWAAAPPDDEQYRIEGDWSRARHVLAASCVADLQRGTIENALDGPGRIADLFSDPQREFLADCGQIRVALGAATVVGRRPIAATQWKDFSVGSVPDVVAERWTVDELDFLELSIRVESGAEDAATAQRTLQDEVASRGLEFADNDMPKTQRVMRRLAGLD